MYNNKIKHRLNYILIVILVLAGFANRTAYGKDQNMQKTDEKLQSDQYTYGIGSVSKMFATVAVMKLVEEGKVDLDTPLIRYIPEFSMADERYKEITPKMLLNHSSGLMGTTSHNGFLFGRGDTSYHDTFLEQLKNQELKADPGEYSVYCNDGFMLADILIERVSGMSFSNYIEKEISTPIGLKHTVTPQLGLDENILAPIYFNNYPLPYANCQTLASGGIYGTPEDLCIFSQVFMENGKTILSKESIDLMFCHTFSNNSSFFITLFVFSIK
jgi:CubicO group peptidase (beta-lactamase class C family)